MAVVCCVAAAIYLSLVHVPFLSWDDDRNISANPYYLHLGWWRLWLRPYFGLYVPVISSLWAGLLHAGGGSASVFRVFNAALHVANTLVVWRLVSAFIRRAAPDRCDQRTSIAVLAGVIVFAIHPLQVGAVAWISGGRDLLAAGLGLSAVLVYFRSTRASYVVATLLFAAGLLSKPSIAGIPLAVVAYTALCEHRLLRPAIRAMGFWCVLVVAVAIGTSTMQLSGTVVEVPLFQRPLVVLDAAGFYLLKLAWPASLSIDYGRTPQWIWSHKAATIPTLAAILGATLAVAHGSHRRLALTTGALWVLLLCPVLGLTPFAFQRISTVADHYAYLPMAAAAALVAVIVNQHVKNRAAIWMLCLVGLAAGATSSYQRLSMWRSEDALFENALANNPRSWTAMISLTRSACEHGRFAAGLDLIEKALRLSPSEPAALADKAYCLFNSGRVDEVLQLRKTLLDSDVQRALDQNDVVASGLANTIAGALFQRGRPDEGWAFLCQALAVNPFDVDLQQNATDIAREFAARGVEARCPDRVGWAAFVRLNAAGRPPT